MFLAYEWHKFEAKNYHIADQGARDRNFLVRFNNEYFFKNR